MLGRLGQNWLVESKIGQSNSRFGQRKDIEHSSAIHFRRKRHRVKTVFLLTLLATIYSGEHKFPPYPIPPPYHAG